MTTLLLTLILAIPPSCPMHAQHMKEAASKEHAHGVDRRHDTFGMSHTATRHHFRLFRDGGSIELLDAGADALTAEAIRTHLQEVAADFTRADFEKPLFVHGRIPPGVEQMKELAAAITYRYEELPRGGRIRITTRDANALQAVHEFLRFQVEDHRTGDAGTVEDDPARPAATPR
jgi:hypothetical protein